MVKTMDQAQQEEQSRKAKEYEKYVKEKTPTHSLTRNMLGAFLSGGMICTLGQVIMNICKSMGMDKEISGSWTSLILILLSVLLTGWNLYPKLAKWGGAGTLVPITGFANSVAAPAIEYQKEGQVFGIGCKIFTIAGPVILYGILTSASLGLIYYFLHIWGIV
ncbi:SpoVA/SpoVAEb family sporulation membrane protein [Blautia sp.]|uniref:SpoVA/SpoVAEb family sporulation membrane protein n=1 Tax=Blautia sp. TaxID=1955243 RepID=UPI002F3E3BF8